MAFPPPGEFRKTQIGFRQMGRRGYARSNVLDSPVIDRGEPGSPLISIKTLNGYVIGKLRTDVQFSIVESIKFTNLNGLDCADFELKLNKIPPFPIEPFSVITIGIQGRVRPVYTGLIEITPQQGTQRNVFIYKGSGFKNYIKKITIDDSQETIAGTGQDIGDIIRIIVLVSVAPFTPIIYDPSLINNTTGVVILNDLFLGKYKINKIFDTFAKMAGAIWGINGEGKLFFKLEPKLDDIPKKTFFIGYNLQSFKPKLNIKDIRNTIVIQRQEGKADGGAGWAIAGIFTDDTSVAKYGKEQLDFQVPGFFEGPPTPGNEIDIIGNALLDDLKEPKFSGTFNGYVIKSGDDFLEDGLYRFIMDLNNYDVLITENDTDDGWLITPTDAGIAKSTDTNIFFSGAGSMKIELFDPSISSETFFLSPNFMQELSKQEYGKIVKFTFWMMSNKIGQFINVGLGLVDFAPIDIILKNRFFKFEWDLTNLNITLLGLINFNVTNFALAKGAVLHIDKMEIEVAGHKFYKLPLTKATYDYNPGSSTVRGELGVLPSKMENYLSGLFSTISEMKFTQEKLPDPDPP